MRATIIGGGITGLTIANMMQQIGYNYALYEAVSELKSTGAGITLSPNALYVFDRLGLYEAIVTAGYPLPRFDITNAKGKVIQKNVTIFQQHGKTYHAFGIHRGELQRILVESLAPERICLGKRLQTLDLQLNQLQFTDGTSIQPDYLLGCDGIHSQVRQTLFPQGKLRYAGQTCWRGVVEKPLSAEIRNNPAELWGDGYRFGYVPIAENRVYWYATAVYPAQIGTPQSAETAQSLATLYRQFTPLVSDMIAATPDEQIKRHDLYDLEPLPTWFQANCLLLGDAAHAMTPNLGQGAAQGIEDAWVFGNCLVNTKTIEGAFQAFEQARFEKVNLVAKRSWQIGQVTNLKNGLLCKLRNAVVGNLPQTLTNRSKTDLFSVPSYDGVAA